MEKYGTRRINHASKGYTDETDRPFCDRICKAGRFPAGGKRPPCFDRPAKTSAGGPKNAERREEPNTNCTVLGYIMPGESVTIIHQLADEMPFAYCRGYVWKYRNGTGSHEFKYGYCSTDYLQIGSGTARVNVSPTAFIAEACFG